MNALGAALILFGFCLGFLHWKAAVKSLLFWVLIEGAIRKWVWPSGHIAIYFIKDFVMLGAVLRFCMLQLSPKRPSIAITPLELMFGLQFLWCCVTAFNPSSPNLLVGLMGIKAYLFYAVLIYLMPDLFSTKEEVQSYLKWFAIASVPVLIVGVLQFFAPPKSFFTSNLDWSGGEAGNQSVVFGGIGAMAMRIRICSTFAYLTEYTGYLAVLTFVLLAITQWQVQKLRWLYYSVSGLTIVNILMTGSRGTVLLIVGAGLVFVVLSANVSFGRYIELLMRVTWVSIVAGLIIVIQFPESISAFTDRVEGENDVPTRMLIMTTAPYRKFLEAGLFGYGVGTTHQATEFAAPDGWKWGGMNRDFEDEQGRVMLEVGLIGFVLVYVTRFLLFLSLLRAYRRIEDWDLRVVLLAVLCLNILMNMQGLIFCHTHILFFWFFSALGLYLPRIENSRYCKTMQAPQTPLRVKHAA